MIIKMLEKHNRADIEKKTILDVGCGNGSLLRFFSDCRCSYKGLFGVDLREDAINQGLDINPSIDISASNAEDLSFNKNSFDIICLQTVFSSIKDSDMKVKIVERIDFLLKNNGLVIWYDFRYNNPKNSNVNGIKKEEIINLFNGYDIDLKSITTYPFLHRKFPCWMWPLLGLLSQIFPFIKTHYIGIFTKKC